MRTHNKSRKPFFFAPNKGGESGGTAPQATLEERLNAAVSARDTAITERDSAIGERDAATSARDTAISERDAAISARDAATAERDSAIGERDAASSARDTATAERDTAIGERDTARANVTRLEALCDLRGIDRNAAVPAAQAPDNSDTDLLARYQALAGRDKTAFFRANRAALERAAAKGNATI